MKSICLIIAVLGFCAVGHAATISESVGLVPGSFNLNFGKLQSVQNSDNIVITFYAKSGYELVKSGVSDISDLGWKQKGNTFSVAVGANKPLAKGSINKTIFLGKLRSIAGGGNNGDKLLDWDATIAFKVLDDHEGAGRDQLRDPVGAMTTDKPSPAPVQTMLATYHEEIKASNGTTTTTRWFTSTLVKPDPAALGHYEGEISADQKTLAKAAKKLGPTEDQPCPDGDKVQVKFVYLGFDGKIAGLVEPDSITMSKYTGDELIIPAATALAAANEVYSQALAAEKEAKAKVSLAEVDEAKKRKIYNDLVGVDPKVKKAQAEYDAAYAALEKAILNPQLEITQAALTNAEAELAAWKKGKDKTVEQFGMALYESQFAVYQVRVTMRQAQLASLKQIITDAQKLSDLKEKALAAAKVEAEKKNAAILAAKAALDVASAAAKAALAEHMKSVKDTAAAKTKVNAAQMALDNAIKEQKVILQLWAKTYAETLLHEFGHRRIAYFYADKITAMMNGVRFFGYAPTEIRAQVLAKDLYAKEKVMMFKETIASCEEFQVSYDSLAGSDHGKKQSQWDWGKLK